jgi:membrane protease YdiL (CAAX protease family)
VSPDHGDYFVAPRSVQPPGATWQPQAWPQPAGSPPPPSWTPAEPEGESGLGIGEALLVTGAALAASLVLTLGMRGQHRDQFDVALRKGLAYTLFFYLVVGSVVGCYVLARRVRLVWHRGSVLSAVAMGIPVGVGGGALAVLLNSLLRGHLSGDANVELLVGGGGALRISLTVVVTSVLAPLVEETVFRGICAGSLLAKGPAAAVWLSALAFAIWHMQPSSLRYYALMGLLLGRLWQKRGLLASMSAHACFNGVLTAAAIAATTGAASYTTAGALQFELPGGWHAGQSSVATHTYLGPGGASLAINEMRSAVSATAVLAHLRANERAVDAFQVTSGSERQVDVAGAPAVEADLTVAAQPGHLLVVPVGGTMYTVVVVTGGSSRGERDWQGLERTLRIAPRG